jgi:hypothetical protein
MLQAPEIVSSKLKLPKHEVIFLDHLVTSCRRRRGVDLFFKLPIKRGRNHSNSLLYISGRARAMLFKDS